MRNCSPDGTHCLTPDSAAYPARLRELSSPPRELWVSGILATCEPPLVAIVGTRRATPYGERVARSLATACARAGVGVISGLALGIDGAAHRATLAADGRTVAVLGTGIDRCYPRQHRPLQEQIAADGALLSEFGPGDQGHAGAFPLRNRLIAALADVTVVVEAPESSGALNTARYARELGRHLGVVPHPIDAASGRGGNLLLKHEHAEPILGADDLLALLQLGASPASAPVLDGSAALCWHAITHGATDAPSIVRATGLPLREVSTVLALLEIDGLVCFDAAGHVRPAVLTG